MIKSPLMLPMPSNNAKLVSNVPPSPLIKQESNNSTLNTCGKAPTVQSETFSTEPSSENLSSSITSQDLFQDGKNPLLLEDTLSEINTEPPILQSINLENLKLSSQIMKESNKEWKSTNLKEKVVLVWQCTTSMKALRILLTAVSNSLFKDNYHFT